MPPTSSLQQRLHAWLSGNPDDDILLWIFRGVVAVTIAVLAADLATTNGWIGQPDLAPAESRLASSESGQQRAPSMLAPLQPDGSPRLVSLPLSQGAVAQPMTFELVSGGRLMA